MISSVSLMRMNSNFARLSGTIKLINEELRDEEFERFDLPESFGLEFEREVEKWERILALVRRVRRMTMDREIYPARIIAVKSADSLTRDSIADAVEYSLRNMELVSIPPETRRASAASSTAPPAP